MLIFINMGRRLIEKNKMKKKISVSIDPDIILKLKKNHINVSSLINNLLRDYINDGKENL